MMHQGTKGIEGNIKFGATKHGRMYTLHLYLYNFAPENKTSPQ
jgi:hypothetical protein